MNLFGIGPTEIAVVLIVILVLFGPDKLPELAKKNRRHVARIARWIEYHQ